MKVERGKVEGDLTICEEVRLHGMVTGTVTVVDGGNLHLHGMVVGDLLVNAGARAELNGTVNGKVTNRGGLLRVRGMVNGQLRHEAGETRLDPNAVVQGGILGTVTRAD